MVREQYKSRIEAVARELLTLHGSPSHVAFLRGVPHNESVIHFPSGAQYAVDSSLFTFGYGGTGPDNFSYLLSKLGFLKPDVRAVKCPSKLDKDGTWIEV